MNKIVSFELAKHLKEKGLDIVSVNCYAEKRSIDGKTGGDVYDGTYKLCTKSRFHKRYYFAPTIAEVVMWIYEKYKIWISVDMVFTDDKTGFCYSIRQSEADKVAITSQVYITIEEAYSAGITKVLKKKLYNYTSK